MTEAQYNSAVAIYNPNGGHKTGKIYDVRDTDNTTPRDLTVTGGGGTRINKAGLVENIVYNNWTSPTWISETLGYGDTVSTTSLAPDGSLTAQLKTDPNANNSLGERKSNYFAANTKGNISIFVKPFGSTNSILLRVGTSDAIFTLSTLSFTITDSENAIQSPQITSELNGWYRISTGFNTGTSSKDLRILAAVNAGEGMYFWGKQESIGSYTLKPYQDRTQITSAAFPKIDYSTGSPAFLIEPSNTNRIVGSNYQTTPALLNVTTIFNDAVAPDGTSTATRLIEDTAIDNYHQISKLTTISTGKSVFSVYYKLPDANRNIGIAPINSGGAGSNKCLVFNYLGEYQGLGTGEITTGDIGDYKVQVLLDGWIRVQVSQTSTSTSWSCTIRMINGLNMKYNGNGSSYLHIWGVQLETLIPVASTLIHTTTAIVTRTLNAFTVPMSNPTDGTLFLHTDTNANGFIGFTAGNNANVLAISIFSSAVKGLIKNGDINQLNFTTPAFPSGKLKIALTFSPAKMALYINGTKYAEGLNKIAPTTQTFHSKLNDVGTEFRGNIFDMKIDKFLTDAEAIALTTL